MSPIADLFWADQKQTCLDATPGFRARLSTHEQLLRLVDGVLHHQIRAEPEIDRPRGRDLRLRPHRVAELELEVYLQAYGLSRRQSLSCDAVAACYERFVAPFALSAKGVTRRIAPTPQRRMATNRQYARAARSDRAGARRQGAPTRRFPAASGAG